MSNQIENNALTLERELMGLSDKKQAAVLRKFFKTGPGEYGEGDVFLGIKVPVIRRIASKYQGLDFSGLKKLLNSEVHEFRFSALIILTDKYRGAGSEGKEKIFNFYLANSKNINNWDLVDVSAPLVVGDYLLDKPRDILYKMAKSENLWQRRIAIISTFAFIRKGELEDTIKISGILLDDPHDLIHKAAGWMLREAGKRDIGVLENFLNKNHEIMPRVMLRYAIEKLERNKRKFYLKKASRVTTPQNRRNLSL